MSKIKSFLCHEDVNLWLKAITNIDLFFNYK